MIWKLRWLDIEFHLMPCTVYAISADSWRVYLRYFVVIGKILLLKPYPSLRTRVQWAKFACRFVMSALMKVAVV